VVVGLVVASHNTATLNRSTFDHVSVSTGSTSTPSPSPTNIVVYASDVTALHGTWTKVSDTTSPNGQKLSTTDLGWSSANAPVAAPANYFDVSFSANANTPYTLWLRLRALNNSKYNDSVWAQFSDAHVNGSPIYQVGSASGLLVNLATDSTG